MGEMFCFRSKFFKRDICKSWKGLQEEKHLCDVTLACTDGHIESHKVVLSACSLVFRNLIKLHPHNHPLLYLRGVKYTELVHMLSFMYQGEINIPQEELQDFLMVGEDLKILGLTQQNKAASAKRGGAHINHEPSISITSENQDMDTDDDKKKGEKLDDSNHVAEDVVTKSVPEEEIKEALNKAIVHNHSIFSKHWDENTKKRGRRKQDKKTIVPLKIDPNTDKDAASAGSSTKQRKRPFPIAKINQPNEEEEIKEPPKKAIVHNHSIFSKHWETEESDDINTSNNEEGFQLTEYPTYFEQDAYLNAAEIENGLKSVWHQAVKEGGYSCEHCDYNTLSNSNFNKHVKAKHLGVRFPCEQCEYKATDQSNLKKHVKSVHYAWPFATFPMLNALEKLGKQE